MAIEHAESGEVVDVRNPPGPLAQAQSTALCKTRDLEVMRLVVPEGRSLPAHHVRGDMTVQCLHGEVELIAGGEARRVGAGHWLWLAGGVEYSIKALQDAALLVTISMPAADKYE